MTSEPQEIGGAGGLAGARRDAGYARGVALVMLAGVFWSLGGVLIRNIETAGEWQILFFRSGFAAALLFCVLAFRHGSQVFRVFHEAGRKAVLGGLCLGCAMSSFVFAMVHTSIANAVFILAVAPLATALLAWLALREAVTRSTWVSAVVALIGIGVMVAGGVAAGTLFGNLMALISLLGFAGFAVILRAGRAGDMLPAACLAGLFAAIGAAIMAPDLEVPARDIAVCAVMGVVQIGAGMVVFTRGSKSVPAAELALLSLTEVVLAPIWVWIWIGEVPTGTTLLGGAIVLLAIAGRALSGLKRKPPPFGAV